MRVMDVEAWLARLVAHETVSDRPTSGLAGDVGAILDDLGFRVEIVEHAPGKQNLVATLGPEREDGTGLCLSGHLDVVPTDGQPWSSDPFVLTRVQDRLVGRGTADMKGFLAAVLTVLPDVDRAALRAPIALVLTADEEVGCLGSAAVAAALRAQGRSLPQACWIGEPTDFRVLRLHPGHVAVDVELVGAAAHTSRPELGANALVAAARCVEAAVSLAEALRQAPRDLPMSAPWVTMTPAQLTAGSAINIVPDRAHLRIGYRPLPGDAPLDVFDALSPRLIAAAATCGCSAHARPGPIVPPLCTPEDAPMARLLAPWAVAGDPVAPFATDGGNLALAGAVPVIFGPGQIDVAHQADEYVAAAALHRAVAITREVLRTATAGIGNSLPT
ncbi:MAG: acetylornithine deacetylase ArgE [Pseudomonadota bacterium]|jgi:acetylornithine deacetylase